MHLPSQKLLKRRGFTEFNPVRQSFARRGRFAEALETATISENWLNGCTTANHPHCEYSFLTGWAPANQFD